MCEITDCIMVPSVKSKWMRLQVDARATLKSAFSHAMRCPLQTSWYNFNSTETRFGLLEMHAFGIGFADFRLAILNQSPVILCDFNLEDGFPLYISA